MKLTINLIKKVKDLGIRPILMTNSNKERTVPFRDGLEIDICASSMKPFSKYYKKILSLYHTEPSHVACIGDQLLTDINGGNKMGITTILVNPVSKIDETETWLNRQIEKAIFKKFEAKNLLIRGKYYDKEVFRMWCVISNGRS